MKPYLPLLAAATVLSGASFLVSSCTTVTAERTTTVDAKPGVPGGKVIQTTEINATVTAIDTTKRKVTLVTRAGEKQVVTAGPEVVNFDQIRVGDQLKVACTEEVVIRMAKPGEKPDEIGSMTGDISKPGDKPGLSFGSTVQTTATVTKIDQRRRKVTLQFVDGSSKKFPVRDDIDMTNHSVGEKVVVRSTEAFAISMTKP